MHLRRSLFMLVLLVGCKSVSTTSSTAVKENKEGKEKSEVSETERILTDLASDNFGGRKPGTAGYEATMTYVESFFKKNKIKPFFETYRDTLMVKDVPSANIVGLIGDHDLSKKHVVIGAHLDHLGPSKNAADSIFNGANDNAAGSTAVLKVAKALNKMKFDYNLILVLFTGEESGLVGSRHLAKKLKGMDLNLAYMLNFEMIGKMLTTGADQVYITGYDKSDLAAKMNDIAGRDFVVFLPEEVSYGLFRRSDNYAFYQEFGVPSHTLSTFDFKNYDHYHKESDEVQLMDIDNMNDVINTSIEVISQMLIKHVEPVEVESKN
ncbi:M28 family metallopeptidase [Fulvivirga ligni]|uniref:M28 family metallopeptidase n=1 Tax=Fulvivirga ligni TaxID=2904246 RepID=UPI001F33283F|nr:M28 family peptidase [Fulvivirga ligni]UII23716.1 M20/M25/M40 family metallo-hydrolase [Fulvivirga ligni]